MEDSYHLGHRAYIYARGSLLHREGGVKKFSKLHLAPGPPLYPQCFLSLRRVKYRYYVFIIIRSSLSRIERTGLASPRLAGRRDNQFITAGASAHLHTREDDAEPSLFSHSPRGYSRPKYKLPRWNSILQIRLSFDHLTRDRSIEKSSSWLFVDFNGESKNFSFRRAAFDRSVVPFKRKVMTLPARNRDGL